MEHNLRSHILPVLGPRRLASITRKDVETWAKAVEGSVQELPAIPVATALPSFEEIISVQFDFAGKVLAAQRDFAEKLVKASAPVIKTTPVEVPTPVIPKA